MKELKNQRGITLIALIITIILLLILAVVTISAVNEGSLFAHANNASTKYKAESEIENGVIDSLISKVPDEKKGEININDEWKYNEKTGKYEKGELSYGDTIPNSEVLKILGINVGGAYKDSWTVLGITDTNKLKLVSTNNVKSNVSLGYDDLGAITACSAEDESSPTKDEKRKRCIWSYLNVENTLDEAVQSATGISSAKSVSLDDIYDIVEDNNSLKGYTYRYFFDQDSGYIWSEYKTEDDDEWTRKNSAWVSHIYEARGIDKKGNEIIIDSNGGEIEITNNHPSQGIKLSEEQKKQIASLATGSYWLKSSCCEPELQYFSYCVCRIYNGDIYHDRIFSSSVQLCYNPKRDVRAIVYI